MSYFVMPMRSVDSGSTYRHTLNPASTFVDKTHSSTTTTLYSPQLAEAISHQLASTTLGSAHIHPSALTSSQTYTQSQQVHATAQQHTAALTTSPYQQQPLTQRIKSSPYHTSAPAAKPKPTYRHKPSVFKVNRYTQQGFFGPELKLDSTAARALARQQQRDQENEQFHGNTKSPAKSATKPVKPASNKVYKAKPAVAGGAKKGKPVSAVVKARQIVLNYLTSADDCALFSQAVSVVAVSDEEIDALIVAQGGADAVQLIVDKLKVLNDDSKRYQSWSDLMVDVNVLLSPTSATQQPKQHEQHTSQSDVLNLESSRPNTQQTVNPDAAAAAHKRRDTGYVDDVNSKRTSKPEVKPDLGQLTEEENEGDETSYGDESFAK